jgi:hypothetical protein
VRSNWASCGAVHNNYATFEDNCVTGNKTAVVKTADYDDRGSLVVGTPTNVAVNIGSDCASLGFAAHVAVPAASVRSFHAIVSAGPRSQTVTCTPTAATGGTDLTCAMPLGGANLFASVTDYVTKANDPSWYIAMRITAIDAACTTDVTDYSASVAPPRPPATTCAPPPPPPPPPPGTIYDIQCLCSDETGAAIAAMNGCIDNNTGNPGYGVSLICDALAVNLQGLSGLRTRCDATAYGPTTTTCTSPGTWTLNSLTPTGG